MLQSQATRLTVTVPYVHTISTDGDITLYVTKSQKDLVKMSVLEAGQTPQLPKKGLKAWTVPCSFATTNGILVSFFSSA